MASHISVLLPESLELLAIRDGGVYVDLTLGRGGTSSAILKRIPHGKLYSFDLDPEALAESKATLESIGGNFELIHANFRNFLEELRQRGVSQIDGLTADLGVSSPQFDEANRGFSYRIDAPLDMRMDPSQALSARQVVNDYSFGELVRIFKRYGEDPDSVRVAKAIVLEREKKPIETTEELVAIIKAAKPMRSLLKKGHPAKQIFQAIRIEVNGELANLQAALDAIPEIMAPKGRVAIISFQSLEDRLVKDSFRALSVVEGNRHEPPFAPNEQQTAPFRALTKKPIEPSADEKAKNPRSASAKLRGIEKKGDSL